MTEKPDFRHIDTWIFDLDNTLYRADNAVFAQIEERMTLFIVEKLGRTLDEAASLRQRYYREYGSTLFGLMAFDAVDPEDFLAYVHDIDLSVLSPNLALNKAFERLDGRRFIFTNGCRHHARRVLDRIGLMKSFDEIWDIRSVGFLPKPKAEAYDAVVAAGAVAPRSAAMFEDLACNLLPAHALGMTTVWIRNGEAPQEPQVAHIHHEIDDLAEFLHAIRL